MFQFIYAFVICPYPRFSSKCSWNHKLVHSWHISPVCLDTPLAWAVLVPKCPQPRFRRTSRIRRPNSTGCPVAEQQVVFWYGPKDSPILTTGCWISIESNCYWTWLCIVTEVLNWSIQVQMKFAITCGAVAWFQNNDKTHLKNSNQMLTIYNYSTVPWRKGRSATATSHAAWDSNHFFQALKIGALVHLGTP